jgi:hypothetical protein
MTSLLRLKKEDDIRMDALFSPAKRIQEARGRERSVPSPRATLASPQILTSEVTRNQEVIHG